MRSDRFRLSLFIAASFSVLGVHLPFWPAWLSRRGLDELEIGTLGLAWAVTRGLASPAWAHFVDRSGQRRRWLIGFACASALAFVPFVGAHAFAALLPLTVVFALVHAPVLPLGENLLILQSRERGLDYGATRLWGSIAFVAASWGGGWLLADGHEERAFGLLLALLSLGALTALGLPADPERTGGPRQRLPVAAVLADRRVVAVLVGGGVLQASHAVYYVFSTLHWEQAGHSTSVIGVLWAEAVIAEAVLFAAARRLSGRLGERGLMLAAVLGGVLRWGALASTTALPVLLGVQWLHALTFSAAHLAVMGYLSRAVPVSQSASAQSLYGALNIGAHALTLAAITPLFARAGAAAYWPMIGVAALGGAIAILGMGARRREVLA